MPDSSATPERAKASFSIWRVLLAVVLIGGPATGIWWYVTPREPPAPPPLYPVRGVAYLDGKPMTDGLVMTKYVGERQLLGGLSEIDENGRFDLMTNLQPGVYPGKHKIMVIYNTGGFPPIDLIPAKYSSKEETPFSIVVDADTQNTPVKLELFGGKEPPPPRPGGGMRYPGPPPDQGGEAAWSRQGDGPAPEDPGERSRDGAEPPGDSEKVN